MIDSYYHGSVKRISPEAPVPVVHVKEIKQYPGGAGNVVSNLSGFGSETSLFAGIGKDDGGRWLVSHYAEHNVKFTPLEWGKPTILKSRILGGRQQMIRFDLEESGPLSPEDESKALTLLDTLDFSRFKGVVISDYNKGFCSYKICRRTIELAKGAQIPVFVDPKGTDWGKYEGAHLVTPNLSELSDVLGEPVVNKDDDVVEGASLLLKKYNLDHILVTRSEMGMTLISPDGFEHIPTEAREVYDVSGAGDTVIATVSYLLSAGWNIRESVKLANQAAGIAVAHSGTWAMDPMTFAGLIHQNFKSSDASGLAASLRVRGKKIVFTNGCFDILHRGHIDYLRRTAELGDKLIVGLNSDASVKRLKGPNRPINDQDARAEVLGALEFVDHVVIFDEDTPYELIKAIRPDVLTKGGDYTPETVVGREFAGKTVIISFVEGYSTTKTIERMEDHG
jgi:D-beta-D-heptose 7-phosphate kinase/D-beta-D-heptose 1-phosphate adenosyltransferase